MAVSVLTFQSSVRNVPFHTQPFHFSPEAQASNVMIEVLDSSENLNLSNKLMHGIIPQESSFNNNNNNNNNNRGGRVTILWNQQVQTDRTIPNNKPDIIIGDNETGACMLIDVAIPEERNVIKKEAKKILNYKNLTIEIQSMWNVKTKVPVAPLLNKGDWDYFKVIQKIREQHIGKT